LAQVWLHSLPPLLLAARITTRAIANSLSFSAIDECSQDSALIAGKARFATKVVLKESFKTTFLCASR
jgi:hypothetical protein